MKLRDFFCLSEVGKEEVVFLKGDYITENVLYGNKVVLYKVDDFFVEVYQDKKKKGVKRYKGCVRSDLLQLQE